MNDASLWHHNVNEADIQEIVWHLVDNPDGRWRFFSKPVRVTLAISIVGFVIHFRYAVGVGVG